MVCLVKHIYTICRGAIFSLESSSFFAVLLFFFFFFLNSYWPYLLTPPTSVGRFKWVANLMCVIVMKFVSSNQLPFQ